MTSDSHLFRTREEMERQGFTLHGNIFVREEEVWLPLYEAKMFQQFDHRLWQLYIDGNRGNVHLPKPTEYHRANMPFFITTLVLG